MPVTSIQRRLERCRAVLGVQADELVEPLRTAADRTCRTDRGFTRRAFGADGVAASGGHRDFGFETVDADVADERGYGDMGCEIE